MAPLVWLVGGAATKVQHFVGHVSEGYWGFSQAKRETLLCHKDNYGTRHGVCGETTSKLLLVKVTERVWNVINYFCFMQCVSLPSLAAMPGSSLLLHLGICLILTLIVYVYVYVYVYLAYTIKDLIRIFFIHVHHCALFIPVSFNS